MKKDQRLNYDLGDPIAKFLVEKMHWSPFRFAALWTAVVVEVGLLIALLTGTLDSPPGKALIDDWVWLTWSFIFTPVIAGYYLWSSFAIDGVLAGLEEAEILKIPEEDKNAIVEYFKKPGRLILAVGGMVVIGIFYYITRRDLNGFANLSLIAKIETSITYAILSYFAIMLISNLVINYWAIRRVIQDKELNINPLHPDRCGGLQILSDYSMKVVYLNTIFGFVVSISVIRLFQTQYGWTAILLVILYLSITTISFFAPLSTAHEEMKEAKTKLLLSLGRQFWKEYLIAHQAAGSTETIKNEIDKIKQLQELYDLTQDFPVWPFDTTTLRRFFVSISSPLIPAIIGVVIDALSDKILPP